MDDEDDVLKRSHKRCMNNRELIADGTPCGCFYCLRTFVGEAIKDWTDAGQTALCPFCAIDSVLSGRADDISAAFLQAMHRRWFETITQWPPTVAQPGDTAR